MIWRPEASAVGDQTAADHSLAAACRSTVVWGAVRLLLDYRPALRERTGVGEFVHQLARALAAGTDQVTVFSASWKDRIDPRDAAELGEARIIDKRIPVRLLNLAWLRAGWPPVERLCRQSFDVVHSPIPVGLPTRNAASVITVHDLDFLDHPERAWAEMRRDYPGAVRVGASRADAVVVPSRYTAEQVVARLGVSADRLFVCPHGLPPGWTDNLPSAAPLFDRPAGKHLLFVGTLTARKNVNGLLDAYQRVVAQAPGAPPLVMAGGSRPEAAGWLERIGAPPLAGRVHHVGYVTGERRRTLYLEATMLVLPSFDEGFGLPVLEAMALGIPVVVSNRGALPEVVGNAGLLVDPGQPDQIADAMLRLLADPFLAAGLGSAGRERARAYSWKRTAELVREAYACALARRAARTGRGARGRFSA